jgi:hypothetical protein
LFLIESPECDNKNLDKNWTPAAAIGLSIFILLNESSHFSYIVKKISFTCWIKKARDQFHIPTREEIRNQKCITQPGNISCCAIVQHGVCRFHHFGLGFESAFLYNTRTQLQPNHILSRCSPRIGQSRIVSEAALSLWYLTHATDWIWLIAKWI